PIAERIAAEGEGDEERLRVDAEPVAELREADRAVRDVGEEREAGGERGRRDRHRTADVLQAREDEEERRGHEEQARPYEPRPEEVPDVRHEVRRLHRDRVQVTWQVREREEAVVEEEITLG